MNKQFNSLYCILGSLCLIWIGSFTCQNMIFSLVKDIAWLSLVILTLMRIISSLGIILLIIFALKLIKDNYSS